MEGRSIRIGRVTLRLGWRAIGVTALAVALCAVSIGDPPAVAAGDEAKPLTVSVVRDELALGKPLTVEIPGLRAYLRESGRTAGECILYLDGRAVEDVPVRLVPGHDALIFDVRRTQESVETWNMLLGSPTKSYRRVSVSVGLADEEAWPTSAKRIPLVVFRPRGFWLVMLWAALVTFLVGFLVAARRTSIIREPSLMPTLKRPYSLGRTQMAVWFVLVLVAFVFLSLITWSVSPLSETAVAMMGISAATGLGATMVERQKDKAALVERQDLLSKRSELQFDVETAAFSDEDLTARAIEAGYRKSQGFARDILRDTAGYNLHRLQIAAWTVVLAVMFVWRTWESLSMPEFSATLLALMGISGGTYIGFKWPEQDASPPPQATEPQ